MDEANEYQIGTPVFIRPIGIYSAIERVHVIKRADNTFTLLFDCELVEYSAGWLACDLEVSIDHTAGETVN
jgi:hypothetical protein